MRNVKILITIDWFLPGTASGGPVRSYANLIEHLNNGFEFYILTRDTDYGSNKPYEDIEVNTWTIFNRYTKIYYVSTSELNKSNLKRIINEVDFDIAFVNGIYSWKFSILPVLLIKKLKKPLIISARGMLNPQAFSVKGVKKKIYLKLARIFGIYSGLRFHATNEDEAKCIKNRIGELTKVSIAANLPRKITEGNFKNQPKNNPVRFVNVARIAVEKGTLKMLQGLKDVKHNIELDIYGPIYDEAYWEKCKSVIANLPKYIAVSYKGAVDSEEIPSILKAYDFFVLLSEGENFGHAILEALSAGLPVIISNKTPWKNLTSQIVGWDIDTLNLQKISEIYNEASGMHQIAYDEWSESAFNLAQKFIKSPELLEQNKALFLDAVKTIP